MRIPSDALWARDHTLGREWSAAFHDRPAAPDGLLYSSRLNEEPCLCLYLDRAAGAVRVVQRRRLLHWPDDLSETLDSLAVAIVGRRGLRSGRRTG